MAGINECIYGIAKQIPLGRVASYGLIAFLTGNPRRSRIVGSAMRVCSDPAVPCHRVVYGDGSLSRSFGSGGSADQAALLRAEGVPFLLDGRVDMARALWRP